ncbi:hypothetical protein [Gracilibacillus sp. YIM 98692]|uniref:DUF7446 family protein n=1 Tax=Gracilibacillus sp. YIM 98692 TaxID=2663532 RepID=UPI0013D616B8|nr:hypothetical protein [Gracilibacillus sp. YIM 98692]
MKLDIRVTEETNRIYIGFTNEENPNQIKKVGDVTDEAVAAVFQYMMQEHAKRNEDDQKLGVKMPGLGELHYYPPDGDDLDS